MSVLVFYALMTSKIFFMCYENVNWLAYELLKVSLSWARQYQITHDGYNIKSFTADVQSYSNEKWVHLFSNGAVARNSESALASGVVHDLGGKWILGFNRYLGSCTPFEAELWGILDGLLILLNKGYKCATIQIDNLEVVNALTVKGWKI
ncbi:hypothetical protein Goari_021062 [Gossypium aridum]|uniref:RNase H type-1 domain-containing protein n=1 Tax=Gossypium aridum TaxID=34290 RepID=A0A7J8YEQ2_GOSAI|nr:hypothetical protein [Gossypium aridum]